MLDLAVFQLNDKVIAFDVYDFTIRHLSGYRRLSIISCCCSGVLSCSCPESQNGQEDRAGSLVYEARFVEVHLNLLVDLLAVAGVPSFEFSGSPIFSVSREAVTTYRLGALPM